MGIEIKVPTPTQTIINLSSKKQDELQKISVQISTGNKYEDYQSMASDGNVERYLSLNSTVVGVQNYMASNGVVASRVGTMEQAISQLQDIATNVSDLIAQTRNGASGQDIPVDALASSMLNDIAGKLNIRFGGSYLFSGTKTDTKPVQNIQTPNLNSDDSAIANYYYGNSDTSTVKISDSQDLSYGINANDEAFKELIASVHLLMEGHANNDDTTLKKAMDMINSAVNKLASIAATARSSTTTLNQANAEHSDVLRLSQENLINVSQTNIVVATTRMSELEATIQATYMAFNRLSGLRLANFL